ncbi:MAG TPA: hypothetical protein VFY44_09370 [Thermoleophilaceae bacterium]|nr:hypothetical protein [Thermoleophilaceae bacterium]
MSAEPTHAPVTYLEPVFSPPRPAQVTSDEALTELALALDTQRSANKAMVEAVKGMDRMLGDQRELNADLARRNEQLEAQMAEYAEAVTRQVADNNKLWCDLRVAEHRLEEWLDKPAWRRLMRR